MTALVLAFLRAHWPKLVSALAGLVLGYVAHRAPSPPAMQLEDVRGYTSDVNEHQDVHQDTGPKDVKGRWTVYAPPAVPQPPATDRPVCVVSGAVSQTPCPIAATLDFEEHDGAVKTDTHTTTTEHDQGERKTDLKLTPGDDARIAVGAGWLFTQDRSFVTADVRVFGGLWLQGLVIGPETALHGERPGFGVGFRVSFR